MKSKEDIIGLVHTDEWMMDVLRAARSLRLSDWWVCAGFVRSKIWDTLHEYNERTPLSDVDVIYYDAANVSEDLEKRLEEQLKQIIPNVPWSVKNQARMHVVNDNPPYSSSTDAMSKFPETATALGLTLDDQDHIRLATPCGIDDVLQIIIRPTPYFSENKHLAAIYEKRVVQKNFQGKWHKVTVIHTT
ncbi:nucleotidyltransferase family protein [Paenibacillus sp. Soil766]|uniref:nucleotidyltransferase family protein n=1 Tax=Paenibacillus sp. Soil766 TaxID=1736404 RepID=UPI0009E81587|nr:nucleotidyltransferase family protein [Paenibacillus sp. Soil766]